MPKDQQPSLDALRALHGERTTADDPTLLVSGVVPEKKDMLAGQFATGAEDAAGYAAYSTKEAVGEDSLTALSGLACELVGCERELALALMKVVTCQKALADVQEKRLPDLMEKHGLPKFDFIDPVTGLKRTIELINDKYRVSMPPKSGKTADPQWEMKHEAIYAWLQDEGQGSIIKRDMEAPLGLMSDDDAAKIAAKFKEDNPSVDVSLKKYVEPATLTALVTKLKVAGKNVNEYIVTKPVREAKVKGAK